MRTLVTGSEGFVARHLSAFAGEMGADVIGLARSVAEDGGERTLAADLRDREATRAAVREAAPEWVFHLAAASSVAESWRDPAGAIQSNLVATPQPPRRREARGCPRPRAVREFV